jgi:hypothetical protein
MLLKVQIRMEWLRTKMVVHRHEDSHVNEKYKTCSRFTDGIQILKESTRKSQTMPFSLFSNVQIYLRTAVHKNGSAQEWTDVDGIVAHPNGYRQDVLQEIKKTRIIALTCDWSATKLSSPDHIKSCQIAVVLFTKKLCFTKPLSNYPNKHKTQSLHQRLHCSSLANYDALRFEPHRISVLSSN